MPLTVLNVSYPLAPVSDETAGGAEQVLATLDEALVAGGHTSLVIAPTGSRCQGLLLETEPVGGILDENAKQLGRMRHRKAIAAALRGYRVDVVHMHGIDFVEYLPETDVPVIVTLHLPPSWYPREALLPRFNTQFVCVSQSQAIAGLTQLCVQAVIENGVRLPEQANRGRKHHRRPYVVSMGRICPEKGFHLAMDAAAKCGSRFLLAGAVYDYAEHRDYFAGEIQPRLNRECRYLGSVGTARKHQLLGDAACVLIPSLVPETSSLVAMEAMACGTPVVAFRAGALCEIVEHGRTGFLVDSVEEMAEAIPEVSTLDPTYCRREAESRFSSGRMAEQYLALYQQTAERTSKRIEVLR